MLYFMHVNKIKRWAVIMSEMFWLHNKVCIVEGVLLSVPPPQHPRIVLVLLSW